MKRAREQEARHRLRRPDELQDSKVPIMGHCMRWQYSARLVALPKRRTKQLCSSMYKLTA